MALELLDFTGMLGKGFSHKGAFGFNFSPFYIILTIFWVWMLVDCLKRNFKKDNEKLIWVIVLLFAHVIGAAIYFFLVKSKNKN